MKNLTLTNDFHNTSVTLRVGPSLTLSARQVARSRRVLCGNHDCTCGGNAGERGPQFLNGDRIMLAWRSEDRYIIERC